MVLPTSYSELIFNLQNCSLTILLVKSPSGLDYSEITGTRSPGRVVGDCAPRTTRPELNTVCIPQGLQRMTSAVLHVMRLSCATDGLDDLIWQVKACPIRLACRISRNQCQVQQIDHYPVRGPRSATLHVITLRTEWLQRDKLLARSS